MFVARIHNNSLGTCVEVDDYQAGYEILEKWIKDQGFEMTEDVIEALENDLEYINDDDESNIFTFTFGEFGVYENLNEEE